MTSPDVAPDRAPPWLSIIVPMRNEIAQLPGLLAHLQAWQDKGHEVLLVDGGSVDGSPERAEAAGFGVLHSSPGRARQMNAGAAAARGRALLFLHADTRLPEEADERIRAALRSRRWGRFDAHLAGDPWMLRVVTACMNARSRLTGIATGDQALFVDRAAFAAVDGFPDQPLMEDIELSKRLKQHGRPCCLRTRVTSSGRRWADAGVWPTIWLMWRLRWAYWRGASPEKLDREYQ